MQHFWVSVPERGGRSGCKLVKASRREGKPRSGTLADKRIWIREASTCSRHKVSADSKSSSFFLLPVRAGGGGVFRIISLFCCVDEL